MSAPAADRSRFDTVSFLSDFGLVDEFVGVVHRVVRSLAPSVTVIDLTHQVPRHDVRAGAMTLWRAAPWLAPGVVVAVVDPGVGTDRRAVAVEAGDGDVVFVGPDNGLLVPAVHRFGPPRRAVALTDDRWHLRPRRTAGEAAERHAGDGATFDGATFDGATFDGRDVFAPVAAHLCNGVGLDALGEAVAPETLVGGPLVLAEATAEEVVARGVDAEVLWVDTYGNAQLGVRPATIDPLGSRVAVSTGPAGGGRLAVRARGYADLAPGALGLIPDSANLVALCLDRASAAAALGLAPGDTVHLGSDLDDADRAMGCPGDPPVR